jgi:hypothetical protein
MSVFKHAAAGALDRLDFRTPDTKPDGILLISGAIRKKEPLSKNGSRLLPVQFTLSELVHI